MNELFDAMLMDQGDKTPDAVNWADISVAHGFSNSNANQNLTGFTPSILVRVLFSAGIGTIDATSVSSTMGHFVQCINGEFSDVEVPATGNQNFTVDAGAEFNTGSGTISIYNLSVPGPVLLDQFDVTVT